MASKLLAAICQLKRKSAITEERKRFRGLERHWGKALRDAGCKNLIRSAWQPMSASERRCIDRTACPSATDPPRYNLLRPANATLLYPESGNFNFQMSHQFLMKSRSILTDSLSENTDKLRPEMHGLAPMESGVVNGCLANSKPCLVNTVYFKWFLSPLSLLVCSFKLTLLTCKIFPC